MLRHSQEFVVFFGASLLVLLLSVGSEKSVARAEGVTYTVTRVDDSFSLDGTLRNALSKASAGDSIVFSESLNGLTLALNSELVANGVSIQGNPPPWSLSISLARGAPPAANIFNFGGTEISNISMVTIDGRNGGRLSIGAAPVGFDRVTFTRFVTTIFTTPSLATNVLEISFLGCAFQYNLLTATGATHLISVPAQDLYFDQCLFFSNSVTNGSLVYIGNSTSPAVEMKNTDFRNNTFVNAGSCIHQDGGTAKISQSSFVSTTTGRSGAAIRFTGGRNSRLDSLRFVDNVALNGGAIAAELPSGGYFGSITGPLEFTRNRATRNGGAIYATSPIILRSGLFSENSAANQGGAIYTTSSISHFADGDVNFVRNSAREGGAIYTTGRTSLHGSNFTANSATEGGGAILVQYNLDLADCEFSSNSARIGGAVLISPSSLSQESASRFAILTSEFRANSASLNGGAVYNSNATTFAAYDCIFTENSANVSGGAIYTRGPASLNGGSLSQNSVSTGDGGAVWTAAVFTSGLSSYSLSYPEFRTNSASNGKGGAIFGDVNSDITLNQVRLVGNRADNGGGVASLQRLVLHGAEFESNSADQGGGGVYHSGSELESTNNTYHSNYARLEGGGVWAQIMNSRNDTFLANQGGKGGGLYLAPWKSGNPDTVVDSCRFLANSASDSGGATFVEGQQIRFVRCLFDENSASVKGGALCVLNPMLVEKCNFTRNTAISGVAIDFEFESENSGSSVSPSMQIVDSGFHDHNNPTASLIASRGRVFMTYSAIYMNSLASLIADLSGKAALEAAETTIYANTVDVLLNASSLFLRSTTVSHNTAAVEITHTNTTRMENTLLCNNQGDYNTISWKNPPQHSMTDSSVLYSQFIAAGGDGCIKVSEGGCGIRPIANRGPYQPIVALSSDSRAIDSGKRMQSLDNFDGRHSERIKGKTIDIGAFEYYAGDPTNGESDDSQTIIIIVASTVGGVVCLVVLVGVFVGAIMYILRRHRKKQIAVEEAIRSDGFPNF